jgi:hypothetical protein
MYAPHTTQLRRNGRPSLSGLALALVGGALACDTSPPRRDAAAALAPSAAHVSVRLDVPEAGAPSLSVLAFRASTSGAVLAGTDVLGVVDPLVAAGPSAGAACERRDVGVAARAFGNSGGRLELAALSDVAVDLGGATAAGATQLRPTARVYPALAQVVSGVVAEAGPLDVSALPETLSVALGDGAALWREPLALPPAPRVRVVAAHPGLDLQVADPARTFVEIRPFGASWIVACPVGPEGKVTVSPAEREHIAQASGGVPVSLEAVWRDLRVVAGAGGPVRLSLEVRSSLVVDLSR